MSAERPLQAGDLVVVVDGHCDADRVQWLGVIRTVIRIERRGPGNWMRCTHCGASWLETVGALIEDAPEVWSRLPWLLRIPPLEELGETSQENIAPWPGVTIRRTKETIE